MPVGGIWIANTPLPNLAFLAKIVDPCGKRHGVLELARQVHCLDDPVDVLGDVLGVMIPADRRRERLRQVVVS